MLFAHKSNSKKSIGTQTDYLEPRVLETKLFHNSIIFSYTVLANSVESKKT